VAIKKAMEDAAGNTGDYWRVEQITIHRPSGQMEARLYQYKSKKDHAQNKRFMMGNKVLVLPIPKKLEKDLLAAFYEAAPESLVDGQAPNEIPFFSDGIKE